MHVCMYVCMCCVRMCTGTEHLYVLITCHEDNDNRIHCKLLSISILPYLILVYIFRYKT